MGWEFGGGRRRLGVGNRCLVGFLDSGDVTRHLVRVRARARVMVRVRVRVRRVRVRARARANPNPNPTYLRLRRLLSRALGRRHLGLG